MRIISGEYKGKRLIAPKNLPVRPTTDMAKEALFNIFSNRFYFEDITVIDLFAGTGNISFEFASRGAKNIHAVDSHSRCAQFISETSKELDFKITVHKSDAFKFLQQTENKADIIFADPPYNMDASALKNFVDTAFEKKLLNQDGIMVIEHAMQTNLSDVDHFLESRKYGSSIFSFFEK